MARQSSHASSRFYGGLKCKGVVYGNIRVSVQGARFLSLWPWSSSTSNSGIKMLNIDQHYNNYYLLGTKLTFDACVSVQNKMHLSAKH